MANADFFKKNTAAGGFTADSYTKKAEQQAPALTPAQQKLARVEAGLPAVLKSQAVAGIALAAAVAVSVVGLGGAKLHSQYAKVADAMNVGVAQDVASGSMYTVRAQVEARAGAAQNVILAAGGFAGVDANIKAQAETALAGLNAVLAQPDANAAELHDADAALEAALNLLHADVQNHAPEALKTGAEQTAFSQFSSAGTILNHLSYNDAAQAYNQKASGFPAGLLGKLWGCGKVELFA